MWISCELNSTLNRWHEMRRVPARSGLRCIYSRASAAGRVLISDRIYSKAKIETEFDTVIYILNYT